MLDNTECTRLVGVGVFSGSFPRFQLGGFAVPAPARVMQSVETVKKAGGNLGQGNRVISARGPDAKFGFPTISYEGQSKRGRPALAHSEKDINLTTYVLVHGGWHGDGAGNVPPLFLRDAGHTVYTPTLIGLGERSHLASPETNHSTHIQDILNILWYEDLNDVILVGHSYGGMVITGVADAAPERIAKIVYLDAFVPEDG